MLLPADISLSSKLPSLALVVVMLSMETVTSEIAAPLKPLLVMPNTFPVGDGVADGLSLLFDPHPDITIASKTTIDFLFIFNTSSLISITALIFYPIYCCRICILCIILLAIAIVTMMWVRVVSYVSDVKH